MQNAKEFNSAITAKVWTIIDALPQRGAILESDARFWVDEVVGKYGDLAIWHATRAGGFGGSQIGALVRNHMGQRADHEQSAHDIVAGTLLRKIPDEPNGHMRRGIAWEPKHRVWFYEKHLAIRDEAGFKALSEGTGPKPWMRYSPDDLVMMPVLTTHASQQLVRKLIDFKAPSTVDPAPKVAFQYVCQLHMGRLVCEHNGVHIDGMLLSEFDWAGWQLKDDDVPHLADLDQLIVASGDYYWDFVLRGELPPYVRKPRMEAEGISEEVKETAQRLARLKAIFGALKSQIDTLDQEIRPALEKVHFGSAKLQLDGISYTAVPVFDEAKVRAVVPEDLLKTVPLSGNSTKRYDEDKMLARLRELGEKTSTFVKPGNLDSDKLYEMLCDEGYDAEAFISEQLRGSLDKKLKEQAKAIVEREYADLIHAVAPGATALVATEEAAANEPNDRVGHETPRYVPRSVAA
jgi:hypothetical protein